MHVARCSHKTKACSGADCWRRQAWQAQQARTCIAWCTCCPCNSLQLHTNGQLDGGSGVKQQVVATVVRNTHSIGRLGLHLAPLCSSHLWGPGCRRAPPSRSGRKAGCSGSQEADSLPRHKDLSRTTAAHPPVVWVGRRACAGHLAAPSKLQSSWHAGDQELRRATSMQPFSSAGGHAEATQPHAGLPDVAVSALLLLA